MMTRTQPGFAMLLVMILVAAGVVLGMSYLSVASLRCHISSSHQALARARYLAESGLQHAMYVLRFQPEAFDAAANSVLGPFQADESGDSYTIRAEAVEGKTGRYVLTSTATIGGVRRSSSMTVQREAGPTFRVNQGLLVGNGIVWTPWGMSLRGDVHVNGTLFNLGMVDGDASATAGLTDPLLRITGATDPSADAVEVPNVRYDDYRDKYKIGGTEYKVVEYKEVDMTSDCLLAGGGAVTATNVGGLTHLKPDAGNTVTLHQGLDFTGTLVIDGDLVLDGANITLTAVSRFPAIVATGRVIVTNAARNVTINGAVVAAGGIVTDGQPTWQSNTTINGALICRSGGYASDLGGAHVLNYDAERARVYDFSLPEASNIPVVTLVEWND